MIRIAAVLRELVSLFVDDVGFAVTILIWLAAIGLILPRLGTPAALSAVALPVGLFAILIESAVRRARRS